MYESLGFFFQFSSHLLTGHVNFSHPPALCVAQTTRQCHLSLMTFCFEQWPMSFITELCITNRLPTSMDGWMDGWSIAYDKRI